MERAADSVAKDGIGCTSQLEHGLNAAAQTMCRELMGGAGSRRGGSTSCTTGA